MSDDARISAHYGRSDLLAAIRAGVAALGKAPDTVGIDDLAPVDEFHIGGRRASEEFLGPLAPAEDDHLLDVGCGLGGTARFVASHYGSRVTGIDLTPEYVRAGAALCAWVGLAGRIALHHASALAMPFAHGEFDGAYMLHVGMNISGKADLCAEVHRVVRPGGWFGVYDVMRVGDGELAYPVPWAGSAEGSAVASPAQYRAALLEAGFSVVAERNRRDFALDFFAQLRARTLQAGGPPPLGLHITMGRDAPAKLQNMIDNISRGCIAPVEMIARKPE